MTTPDPTGYFDTLAETYATFRPDYPPAAMESVIAASGGSRPLVVDVGCGTGISSRRLAAAGARVIAIDPSPSMLDQARADSGDSDITYRVGTGEDPGLDDASVDIVACAQSFHWFDRDNALAAFARLLRPGGHLALIWNVKRDDPGFSAVYMDVVRRAQADAASRGLLVRETRADDPATSRWFEDSVRRRFDNPHRMPVAAVVGRLRSCSYCPPPGPLRDELEGRLLDACDQFGDDDGVVTIAQDTEVTIARRRSDLG